MAQPTTTEMCIITNVEGIILKQTQSICNAFLNQMLVLFLKKKYYTR